MQESEKIQIRNDELSNLIANAEKVKDIDLAIKLKRELYQNKLSLLDLIRQSEKRAGVTARELIKEVNSMKQTPRYGTGINILDEYLHGGFETGNLVVLAGESFVGKTHLFLEILSNVADGNKAVFFNFEMGKKKIAKRLTKLLNTDNQLDNMIIDSSTRSLEDMIMEIELYAKDGIKFFAIDSRMKIEVKGDYADHQKTSKISSELSKLSQQKDIIILLVNQMSEDDIKNKRLSMKNGGDQKYDADIVFFYVKDEKGNRNLICTKNRQDEYEFAIGLKLDQNNKTVSAKDPEITNYNVDIPYID